MDNILIVRSVIFRTAFTNSITQHAPLDDDQAEQARTLDQHVQEASDPSDATGSGGEQSTIGTPEATDVAGDPWPYAHLSFEFQIPAADSTFDELKGLWGL